ncbi:tyrosine-type recombinase/integrase [Edaphovirga cremea]|uniref:tyrosine-type recombinase/integrase n=1 Tax=Edaphovirga cremea TaxID=2267246 RepID=UPI0024830A0D|nr:site-specific integrase [Edaphovirga cremea]
MEKTEKKPLSTKAIEAMKPGDKDKADTGENRGLRLTCGATGIKTFFYRYTSPLTHKLTQVKIGHFPNVSLAQARAELQTLKQVKNEGRCPASELKAEKHRKQQTELAAQKTVFTVKDLVELYLTQHIEDRLGKDGKIIRGSRKLKGQYTARRTLTKDIVDKIGKRHAQDITRKDVLDLIMTVVKRGANTQAGIVLRELCSAYEFALGLGKLDENFANPALLAKASLAQAKIKLTSKPGKRFLSKDELTQLVNWLPGSTYPANVKNALRLTLWTGCRSGEICAVAWKDVNLEDGTIHLRETKSGIGRYVQLSQQAIQFLQQLPSKNETHLFSSQYRHTPIVQEYLNVAAGILRKEGKMLDIDHWTPHDLRRTVRTGLASLGCPNEIAEAVLGHSPKGVIGVYNLHTYDKECKAWLQKWADHLDTL